MLGSLLPRIRRWTHLGLDVDLKCWQNLSLMISTSFNLPGPTISWKIGLLFTGDRSRGTPKAGSCCPKASAASLFVLGSQHPTTHLAGGCHAANGMALGWGARKFGRIINLWTRPIIAINHIPAGMHIRVESLLLPSFQANIASESTWTTNNCCTSMVPRP